MTWIIDKFKSFILEGVMIKMLKGLQDKIDGYKVHILAISGILASIAGWANHQIDTKTLVETVYGLLMTMAARSALKKLES